MKKLIAILLCLAMLLTLAACNTSGNDTSGRDVQQNAGQDTQQQQESNIGNDNNGAEEVTLSVILITGYEFYQNAIDAYCKDNPNVKVEVQTMDTDSYKTIIKTKFASDDAPDIVPIFAEADYFSYYDNGYLADLSDMNETLDRLNSGAIDSFITSDGGVMGIPYVQQFLLAYYNKDLFQQYGLSVPTTYEELMSVCKTLKDNGIIPVAQGHKDTWVTQMLTYSLNATSVQAADPTFYEGTVDGTNKFVENAGWLDTLTKYDQMIKDEYINAGSLSMTSEQMYEMFVTGEAAMTFTGAWGDANIYALNPEFEVGGFPIPAAGGNEGVSTSISGGLGIYGGSDNMDAAKELLTYMLSKETMEAYGGNLITCFSDVDTTISDALLETQSMMAGKKGYQFDNIYFASGVQEIMFASIQEMIDGSKTPLEVLQDMDTATAKANK